MEDGGFGGGGGRLYLTHYSVTLSPTDLFCVKMDISGGFFFFFWGGSVST